MGKDIFSFFNQSEVKIEGWVSRLRGRGVGGCKKNVLCRVCRKKGIKINKKNVTVGKIKRKK